MVSAISDHCLAARDPCKDVYLRCVTGSIEQACRAYACTVICHNQLFVGGCDVNVAAADAAAHSLGLLSSLTGASLDGRHRKMNVRFDATAMELREHPTRPAFGRSAKFPNARRGCGSCIVSVTAPPNRSATAEAARPASLFAQQRCTA